MSENSEKCQSQAPKVTVDIFKLLVFFDQPSKMPKYSGYWHKTQRKTANIDILEAGNRELWAFLLKK